MLRNTAWWIAFGPHGPRAEDPPGEWTKIMWYTTIGVAVSAALFFGIHAFARPPPRTMTKEWQEATNEYLKVCCLRMLLGPQCRVIYIQGDDFANLFQQKERVNPIYGISSEGYKGKGYVQSKSAKAQGINLDPEE